MTRRPTIKDVAESAGVSTATVSYVLNGTGSVSESTAERVLDCVERLGYRANSVAVAHRTGRSGAIGLAVPDLSNPFFTEFAQGVHGAASANGYSVLLLDANNSAEEEETGIQRLSDRVPEGLIWIPVFEGAAPGPNLSFPTVIYGNDAPGFDTLDTDARSGGQLQAEAALACGHSRIGLLGGPDQSATAALRRQGFIDRIGSEAEIVWDCRLDYGSDYPADFERKILEADEVTCAVAGNDIQAIGLLRLYRSAGRRVPEEISVIGFDDIDLAALVGPQLTTVHLGTRNLGIAALNMLANRIANPDAPVKRELIAVSMSHRESLRQVRGRR